MRHRNNVSPTARLVVVVTSHAARPLSYTELMEATGSSRSTLERILPGMVKRNLVVRITRGGMSYFAAPLEQVAGTSEVRQ